MRIQAPVTAAAGSAERCSLRRIIRKAVQRKTVMQAASMRYTPKKLLSETQAASMCARYSVGPFCS